MEKRIPQVGDTVRITKSKENWSYDMNNFIGLELEIKSILPNGDTAKFKSSKRGLNSWDWNVRQGHVEVVSKKEPEFIFGI